MVTAPEHVLVTGGAGFIGSFVVERLIADGHRVRVLDSLDAAVHRGRPPEHLSPGAELVIGDVRDPKTVWAALDGAGAVVHAAAAVGVGQSAYEIERYVAVNVGGTANLLQAVIDRGRPLRALVVFGSMTGYGEGAYRRVSDGTRLRPAIRTEADVRARGWEPACPETGERLVAVPTREDDLLLATNVYALTKRYQEELALSTGGTFGVPVASLRLFNVFGPRQSLANPYTGVLSIFLARLLAGRPPVVYEDGGQTRDFVSVHDVARVAAGLVGDTCPAGGVFNLGSGTGQGIGRAAETLAGLLGVAIAPDLTERFRRGDVRHCVADVTRAREQLGYQPGTSFEAGLRELVAWARSAPSEDHLATAEGELRRHGLLSEPIPGSGSVR